MGRRPKHRQTDTAAELLSAAEARVRVAGYHGVSFRDLARDVGITSASVHHHFATKTDLGRDVARAYGDRFIAGLGDPSAPDVAPAALIARFVEAFRRAAQEDGRMCLCGVLGAEAAGLPPEVAAEARRFFDRCIAWLVAALGRRGGADVAALRPRAVAILAVLEGALVLSNAGLAEDGLSVLPLVARIADGADS